MIGSDNNVRDGIYHDQMRVCGRQTCSNYVVKSDQGKLFFHKQGNVGTKGGLWKSNWKYSVIQG